MGKYVFWCIVEIISFLIGMIFYCMYPYIPIKNKNNKIRKFVMVLNFFDVFICGCYFGMIAHSLGVR